MRQKEKRMHQARILVQQDFSQKAIAEILGVSDRMVRYYLKSDDRPKDRPKRKSKLDPFKSYIESILDERPDYNLVLIMKSLQRRGYNGGMTILREWAAEFRDSLVKQAVIRFETEPGRQAQVDWMEAGRWDCDGQWRKVYAFVMLLGYSRGAFVMFTTSMKSSVFLACHLRAFEHFSGVPREVLYDNMKTAWLHTDEGWEPNPRLLHLASACGFMPKRCRVRRPQTKGKVERFIRYIGEHFLAQARETGVRKIEELNERVNAWISEVDTEVLREFCETRGERFERERPHLQPFVREALPDVRDIVPVAASREGHIIYETNRYSVPARCLGRLLTLKVDLLERTGELFLGQERIRSFPLLPSGSRSRQIWPDDREELLRLWEKQNRPKPSPRRRHPTRLNEVDVRHPSYYERCARTAV